MSLVPILGEDQWRRLEALERKHVRICESLSATARKATHDLLECRRYRDARRRYGEALSRRDADGKQSSGDAAMLADAKREMERWERYFGVTRERFRKQAEHLAAKQGFPAALALSDMETVWQSVESVVYGGGGCIGTRDHALTRPVIRARQIDKALPLKVDRQRDMLFVQIGKDQIYLRDPGDRDPWLSCEYRHMIAYLLDPHAEDAFLVSYAETGIPQNTHRPCYVQVVSEFYRGRWHYRFQVVMEGRPFPKCDGDGVIRHDFPSDGEVGVDLGTQTFAACASDGFVGLSNLGERGYRSTFESERERRRIQRGMERCRADARHGDDADASMPSGRYERLRARLHDVCRRDRINRRLANAEDANRLRSHGATLVTEDVSVASWARRARKTASDDEDRRRCRKRHGRSIQNRCPGQFLDMLRQRFPNVEYVDGMFRASQYDHMSDEYVRKPLGMRTHSFADGRSVPRDLYSAFLLLCHDERFLQPDRAKCLSEFDAFYERARDLTDRLSRDGVKYTRLKSCASGC